MNSDRLRDHYDRRLAETELPLIELRRNAIDPNSPKLPMGKSFANANNLVGLALSGGGIRSAAFNLGLTQSLIAKKILSCFDYLSTVSGGGYLGTYISSHAQIQDIGSKPEAGTFPTDVRSSSLPAASLENFRAKSNYLSPSVHRRASEFLVGVAFAARGFVVHLFLGLILFGVLGLPLMLWINPITWIWRGCAFPELPIHALALGAGAMIVFHITESVFPVLTHYRSLIHRILMGGVP